MKNKITIKGTVGSGKTRAALAFIDYYPVNSLLFISDEIVEWELKELLSIESLVNLNKIKLLTSYQAYIIENTNLSFDVIIIDSIIGDLKNIDLERILLPHAKKLFIHSYQANRRKSNEIKYLEIVEEII